MEAVLILGVILGLVGCYVFRRPVPVVVHVPAPEVRINVAAHTETDTSFIWHIHRSTGQVYLWTFDDNSLPALEHDIRWHAALTDDERADLLKTVTALQGMQL